MEKWIEYNKHLIKWLIGCLSIINREVYTRNSAKKVFAGLFHYKYNKLLDKNILLFSLVKCIKSNTNSNGAFSRIWS